MQADFFFSLLFLTDQIRNDVRNVLVDVSGLRANIVQPFARFGHQQSSTELIGVYTICSRRVSRTSILELHIGLRKLGMSTSSSI